MIWTAHLLAVSLITLGLVIAWTGPVDERTFQGAVLITLAVILGHVVADRDRTGADKP